MDYHLNIIINNFDLIKNNLLEKNIKIYLDIYSDKIKYNNNNIKIFKIISNKLYLENLKNMILILESIIPKKIIFQIFQQKFLNIVHLV